VTSTIKKSGGPPAAPDPANQADEPAEDRQRHDRDDQGAVRRIERRRDRLTERRPAAVSEIEAQDNTDHDPDDRREAQARAEPRATDPEREEQGDRGEVEEEEGSQQYSPADRPEEPVAEEEHEPDRQQQAGDEQEAEGNGRQGHHPLDLVEDLARLGLRQVDVGSEKALAGLERGADLLPDSGRALPGSGGNAAFANGRAAIRSAGAVRGLVGLHATSGLGWGRILAARALAIACHASAGRCQRRYAPCDAYSDHRRDPVDRYGDHRR